MNKNKEGFNQEIAVLQLVNRHFWKSKIGPLNSIIIPFFLMIMYKIISKSNSEIFVSGLPSYLAFCILPLCFVSLPQMIVEFKVSIILRKIFNSRITSSKFIFIILSYSFIAIISSTIIIFLVYIIFLNVDAHKFLSQINWIELLYVLLNVYVSGLAIGLFLGTILSKINTVPTIGFAFIIVSITFSGQFIPISVLSRSDAIRYIALFSPISYSLNLMNVVLLPDNKDLILQLNKVYGIVANTGLEQKISVIESYHFKGIFDFSNSFKIFDHSLTAINDKETKISKITITTIYQNWQNIVNVIMPYVISTIFILISIKKFKWTSR